MKIAICDDELISSESLQEAIQSCEPIASGLSISSFASGESLLLEYANNKSFDLIFLDIEMPGLNGIETGEKLREIDQKVLIVFLTNHMHYIFQSLKVEIFDYIVKPVQLSFLKSLLLRAIKKQKNDSYAFELKWKSERYLLEPANVVYVEGYKRHMVFFTPDEQMECVGKLRDYEEKLAPFDFIRCHQNFLINMKYIKSIEKNKIYTKNHVIVDLSARKRSDCLKAYSAFLSMKAL